MQRFIWRDMVGFGFGLWLFGYILGMVFYALVPPAWIGWFVMPIGTLATIFVLWKWVRVPSVSQGINVGVVWCVIAMVCDYLAIVKLNNPPDGYYKLDVNIYYLLTLILPPAAGRFFGRHWTGA